MSTPSAPDAFYSVKPVPPVAPVLASTLPQTITVTIPPTPPSLAGFRRYAYVAGGIAVGIAVKVVSVLVARYIPGSLAPIVTQYVGDASGTLLLALGAWLSKSPIDRPALAVVNNAVAAKQN